MGVRGEIVMFTPMGNPIGPSPLDVDMILIAFIFTFVVEGFGLWFLLKILKLTPKLRLVQILGLVLLLNLVTYFFGDYVLLPFLSPWLPKLRIIVDPSAFLPIGLIFCVGFLLGLLYGRKRKAVF